MKEWIKPTERLPAHNDYVLVRKDSDVSLAIFDAIKKVFQVSTSVAYSISEKIEWAEILRSSSDLW